MERIFAIAMITGAFCYYQNNKISITNLKINLKVNNKIRIVQISDLHSKEFGKNNSILYKIIMEQKPDIIVATGDLIDSNMKRINKIIEFCSRLNKKVPVYYILGNNEIRCSRLNEIIEKLKEKNINVLENEIATIKIKDNTINILGLAEKRVDKGKMFYSKINSRYEVDNADSLFRRVEKINKELKLFYLIILKIMNM